MTKNQSKYRKRMHAVHLEPKLIDILREESKLLGCIKHPNVGFSVSEIVRRLVKGRLLQRKEHLKINKYIDWDEAI